MTAFTEYRDWLAQSSVGQSDYIAQGAEQKRGFELLMASDPKTWTAGQ
jgi:hypothetical protein